MAVLKGYSHLDITCEVCKENYIAIESTDDPDVVLLRCWCGATCKGPKSHPAIQKALGSKRAG